MWSCLWDEREVVNVEFLDVTWGDWDFLGELLRVKDTVERRTQKLGPR